MSPTPSPRPAQQPAGWRALSDLTDDRLVALARNHNLEAFEALMRRHNRRLFRVTRSVLRDGDAAQDAVQETYLRAFTKLDSYQPSGRFGASSSRVAFNEALMMRRRTRNDPVSLEDAGVDAMAVEEAAVSDATLGGPVRGSHACTRAARTRHRRVAGEFSDGFHVARGGRAGRARDRGMS